jgi:hypothetical protein
LAGKIVELHLKVGRIEVVNYYRGNRVSLIPLPRPQDILTDKFEVTPTEVKQLLKRATGVITA